MRHVRTVFLLLALLFLAAWLYALPASALARPPQQESTPTPYYIPSKLVNAYSIDIPACYSRVNYPSEGWLRCDAAAGTIPQTLEAIWPDTALIFDLPIQVGADTYLAMEVHQEVNQAYPGVLEAALQVQGADGQWMNVEIPTVRSKTVDGVLQGQPFDFTWVERVPYGLWALPPQGPYRLVAYGEARFFDGALTAYWPSKGSINVYSFNNIPPPTAVPATFVPQPSATLAAGDLSIQAVHVFQAVEGSELAAGRWTVVQVFPAYAPAKAGETVTVQANLVVNGVLFESRSVKIKSQSEYTPSERQRGLNAIAFFLPPEQVKKSAALQISAVLDAAQTVPEPNENNNSLAWNGPVYDSYPIDIAIAILDPQVSEAAASAWADEARTFLMNTYPAPAVSFTFPPVYLDGDLDFWHAVTDAMLVDVAREAYGTRFAVGLFSGWPYGERKRGFNSPFVPYAPVVGVEWPNTLAHEIGHTYLGEGEEASESLQRDGIALPEGFIFMQNYKTLRYIPADSTWINFMGDPHADGISAWVNPQTYNYILHQRETGLAGGANVAARRSLPKQSPPLLEGDCFARKGHSLAMTKAAEAGQTLVIFGSLSPGGKLELFPPYVRDGAPTLASQLGSYTAELYAADGSLLAAETFPASASQAYGLDEPSQPTFHIELPYSAKANRLILSDGRQEIYRLERSDHPPQVRVEQPGDGKPVDGTVTASWKGSDADGDALTYHVYYSQDGTDWKPLALFWKDTTLPLDGAYLPGSETARLRVVASDGLNVTAAESPAFQVPRHAPRVSMAPFDPQESWYEATPGLLAASAMDIEDGALPDTAYAWSSDRDGALGQGSSLFAGLSIGMHQVTVTVTDADGQQGSASASLTVQGPAGKMPVTRLRPSSILLYVCGGLGLLLGVAGMLAGVWVAFSPEDKALKALHKEGQAWLHAYKTGQVEAQHGPQIVERLRKRDRRGAWWMYDPFREQWARWNGRAWRVAKRPKISGGGAGRVAWLFLLSLAVLAATGLMLWQLG